MGDDLLISVSTTPSRRAAHSGPSCCAEATRNMGYALLASILAPLAQDPCLPVVEANVFRDPHVSFAYGGSADFRGHHKVIYNFLSAPDFAVNVKTEEAVFRLHNGALTVNGSFLTEAHIITRFAHQRSAFASFWASELDVQNFGWQVVNGSCAGRPFKFGNRGSKTYASAAPRVHSGCCVHAIRPYRRCHCPPPAGASSSRWPCPGRARRSHSATGS